MGLGSFERFERLIKLLIKFGSITLVGAYLIEIFNKNNFSFSDLISLKKTLKHSFRKTNQESVELDLTDPANGIIESLQKEFEKSKKVKVKFDKYESPTINLPNPKSLIIKTLGFSKNLLFKGDKSNSDSLIRELMKTPHNEGLNDFNVDLQSIIDEYSENIK